MASSRSIEDLSGQVRQIGIAPVARGGAATVWRGQWVGDPRDEELAIKVALVDPTVPLETLKKRLKQEILVWKQLSHKNILELYGWVVDTQFGKLPALVAPLCHHGNLSDLLKTMQHRLDRLLRYNIIRDFTEGLLYMHTVPTKPVMHGDLKSPNILIADGFVAKIADFGLSRTIRDSHDGQTMTVAGPGTVRWMTPEAVELYTNEEKPERPNSATDIWAWGHLVYETVTGKLPYPQCGNEFSAIKAIKSGEINPRPVEDGDVKVDSFLIGLFWPVLEKCWAFSPAKRPTIAEIIRTAPFVNVASQPNDDPLLISEEPARFDSALGYHKQADVEFRHERYREALDYYEKARQLFEQLGDLRRHANCLRDLGWNYIRLGNHTNSARTCFINAKDIFVKTGDLKAQLDTIQDLAAVERAAGNLVPSRTYLDYAYEQCRRAGLPIRSGWCLIATGLLDVDIEDWDAAHRHFEQAVQIALQEQDQGLRARSRERQGDCYMRQGIRSEARRCFDDAARGYRSLLNEEDQVQRVERKIQECHNVRYEDISAMPLWGINNIEDINHRPGPYTV